ncbi:MULTISPECIES: hypothetical protein [Enterobacterales]|jgi:hypothetical protein|uniref:Uncharacterized protein n=1 Tax=Klebsiella pneumoniae TaxID=573 RepID=A0A7H4IRT0_KLEPN|nr:MULTISPECIES: hypothetical protein [Enterobacterales]MBK2543490.1 hypothetical protein [Klebsiella quasipneumoniae]MCJ5645794.1 hypothetical protein [Klebsiella pneumoniae]MDZ3661958.1 hypothetical protein [Klebsiella pneumoniae]MEE2273821.1 hypothetical protein [Klebsiella pneumoniae]QOC48614.1 hypothetical protein ICU34_00250 [Klebsiella pneumoniae]
MLQAKIHIVLISLSTGEGGSSTGVLLNHTAATRRRTFDHQQQLIQKGFEKGIQLARQEGHSEGF